MGRIVLTEFVTLDGVMQDPGGADGFARGGWAFKFERGPEGDKFKYDETMAADMLLLGRITYEGFSKAWPTMTGEFADKMNNMPKMVVSSTLKDPTWKNSKVISSNVVEEISRLRSSTGGNILVAGSGQLAQALMENDLVDEYRLMVYPVILGDGKRLFREGKQKPALKLIEFDARRGWHPNLGLSAPGREIIEDNLLDP